MRERSSLDFLLENCDVPEWVRRQELRVPLKNSKIFSLPLLLLSFSLSVWFFNFYPEFNATSNVTYAQVQTFIKMRWKANSPVLERSISARSCSYRSKKLLTPKNGHSLALLLFCLALPGLSLPVMGDGPCLKSPMEKNWVSWQK